MKAVVSYLLVVDIQDELPSNPSEVDGYISPEDDVNEIIGEWRGIQGDNNSCYMDSSLMAMFAFNTAFDHMFSKTATSDRNDIKDMLLRQIVNPLRK